MIKKINHIGIVVENLEEGKRQYGQGLGLEYLRDEVMPEYGCEIAFFQCGEVLLELIHPTSEGASWNFLKSKGPGIHHICYETDDIHQTFQKMRNCFVTDYKEPAIGAGGKKIFFLQSQSIGMVETEFTD